MKAERKRIVHQYDVQAAQKSRKDPPHFGKLLNNVTAPISARLQSIETKSLRAGRHTYFVC